MQTFRDYYFDVNNYLNVHILIYSFANQSHSKAFLQSHCCLPFLLILHPSAPTDFTILLLPVPQFSSLFQGLESICKYFQDRVQMNPPRHFKGILQYLSTPISLTPYIFIAP